tara:strand:+ start:1279 stop:2124 length:846 start_codon:yes stop_codon:yes gene_type:complete
MNERLVTEPGVHLVGMSKVDPEGFAGWLQGADLVEVAENNDTPLGKITEAVADDKFTATELIPELAGRFCYRSWEKGRDSESYIENILEAGHGSILEHVHFNFAIDGVSRALTHELVRHRQGVGISQESQRFVDAESTRFVVPPILLALWGTTDCAEAEDWMADKQRCVEAYLTQQEYIRMGLEAKGVKGFKARKMANEAARAELPNAAETRIFWTVNVRSLRHILAVRGAGAADMEIRRLALALLRAVHDATPILFKDFSIDMSEDSHGVPSTLTDFPKV